MTYKIVAAGIANSGKSSVLSAIAGERGLFHEDDVPRITQRIQKHKSGNLTLVDTPGLDADEKDSRKQIKEMLSADTVLWCHNLRRGELGTVEVEALKQYAQDTHAIWRTCFVLTHGDDVANRDVIRQTSATIAKQLHIIFHLHFIAVDEHFDAGTEKRPRPFNVIGVERYWKGIKSKSEKKDFWLQQSGIPQLRDFLNTLAAKKNMAAHVRLEHKGGVLGKFAVFIQRKTRLSVDHKGGDK